MNDKTVIELGFCMMWKIMQILEDVKSTKADPNDILLDLRNSSHPTQPLSKTAD